MRLWSIHPKYLDAKGLVALWREGLLARKVLAGKTKGYGKHPQLERFRNDAAIDPYLSEVLKESCRRNYCFDKSKIAVCRALRKSAVSSGQLEYEIEHLKAKLKNRDRKKYCEVSGVKNPLPNPVFKVKKGGIERWEKVR